MAKFASSIDVAARIPYRTIDKDSSPTAQEVEGYLLQAEKSLLGVLLAGGCTIPEANVDGATILQRWIVNYAEGVTRQAYANAGGDGGNDDGQDLIDKFEALLDAIRINPAGYCAEINGGAAAGDAALRVRSYVNNNSDGKTIANGDFDPIFDRDMES